MSTNDQTDRPQLDQLIEDEFGVNADYVGELFQQFESDPGSVDEEWRAFFKEILANGSAAADGDRSTGTRRSEAGRGKGGPPETVGSSAASGRAQTEAATAAGALKESIEPSISPPSTAADPSSSTTVPMGSVATPAPIGRHPAPSAASPAVAATSESTADERIAIKGPALRIAQNMETSLGVPTATSQRQVPVKLLEENRRLINDHLKARRKVSYTHLIARAILKAIDKFPHLNDSYQEDQGVPYRIEHREVNLGLAVDVTRKDGSRVLLVPNIKSAGKLSFPELLDAYDSAVGRAREGKLQVPDFQGTTLSLTNPGTIGTTASNPRLMAGQGLIVATGAIEYAPEYHAMSPEALSRLGISRVMTITSTYDHRIIQGAESGSFLALIDEMLRGGHGFYDQIFTELGIPFRPYKWAMDRNPAILGEQRYADEVRKQARVWELINAYRVRGHLTADINPLGWNELPYHPDLDIDTYGLTIWDLDREFISSGLVGSESAVLREIIDRLRKFYCRKFGIEYRNIQSPEEKEWIRRQVERDQPPVPGEVKRQILWKLISAELFEKFLGTKYLGQKRFSVEGAETVVALLDQLIEQAAGRAISDITIGMSHRGRLNVIANVIGRFCERIFTTFEGSIHPEFPHDQGDVKYHQGAAGVRETANGNHVTLTVPPNPSHLEFVDPVVEGIVRAKEDLAMHLEEEQNSRRGRLAVLVHGDAAFAGEGIVAETLNLSGLEGYSTGGTIHIIVNNQVGFTTPPEAGRTSVYSTDVAKMIQIPIFHVNGDDPEAAFNVLVMALDYRERFKKDVVIDVIGFRRHGHNEGDEPTYTQPVMYKRVRPHPGVRALYADRLIAEGLADRKSVESLMEERTRRYENALLGAKQIVSKQGLYPVLAPANPEPEALPVMETGIAHGDLLDIARKITTVPREFNLNPKITSLLARRAKMVDGSVPVDFGTAEALAFGSLLLEGIPIRISGQDTIRGTFSHRHAEFFDTQTDQPWTPLERLSADQARFQIYDSPLSEAGALGFEYGYSIACGNALVLWEAQFGDFVNAAQVIVDQFIAAGEEKWDQKTRLVLLLPHGYEGQGPEHSSARLERFLNLCAGHNMRVANCSTAAQYFHLLRRQARHPVIKPLVLMTPKSLLRSVEASSPIEQFVDGHFEPILADPGALDASSVRRILMCSGKVYYDLAGERKRLEGADIAIIRVEQFYPFPKTLLGDQLELYRNAAEIVWVQEEPANMGGWGFMERKLRQMLKQNQALGYVGRAASASPATGSHTIHQMEQARLVSEAFAEK
jgi:multifunctional 2-oxoglutarate metabolism enzyme